MNEQQIRSIVNDEIKRQMFQSGKPQVLVHQHNGVDSPQIESSNVVNSPTVMGKINFASNKTYTLYFSYPNPHRLDLNGFAFNGSDNSCAFIVGVASLSLANYFQPVNTSSAKEGGTQYPINGVLAQCSSNLYVNQTTGGQSSTAEVPFPHTEQFYIANAFSTTGVHLVTAQLQNLTPTSIDVVITNLAGGWTLSANFIIT